MKTFRVLIANGVNLDLLGRREPEFYGRFTLSDIESDLTNLASQLRETDQLNVDLEFYQTNSEFEFLESFDRGFDGILINAGAWTHTSLAIADRLTALQVPYVEVHISNLEAREKFRQHSYLSNNAIGVIQGLGRDSYTAALSSLCRHLGRQ